MGAGGEGRGRGAEINGAALQGHSGWSTAPSVLLALPARALKASLEWALEERVREDAGWREQESQRRERLEALRRARARNISLMRASCQPVLVEPLPAIPPYNPELRRRRARHMEGPHSRGMSVQSSLHHKECALPLPPSPRSQITAPGSSISPDILEELQAGYVDSLGTIIAPVLTAEDHIARLATERLARRAPVVAAMRALSSPTASMKRGGSSLPSRDAARPPAFHTHSVRKEPSCACVLTALLTGDPSPHSPPSSTLSRTHVRSPQESQTLSGLFTPRHPLLSSGKIRVREERPPSISFGAVGRARPGSQAVSEEIAVFEERLREMRRGPPEEEEEAEG